MGYPCVLVRLSRVHQDALRDLVTGVYRYVLAKSRKKPPSLGKTPLITYFTGVACGNFHAPFLTSGRGRYRRTR